MILAVAPVVDLWKMNFRFSKAEFDEICNEAEACNFTKINTSPWVIFTSFKLYKRYQIVQHITHTLAESQNITNRKEGCCCIVFS